jgi:hypothetical protein
MLKFVFLVVTGMILFGFNPSHAHENTVLTLKNGRLIGLPKKYEPAFLSVKKFRVQIANNRLDFPPCVKSFFPKAGTYQLVVSASWYNMSTLPPYMELWIIPDNKKYQYELYFNLNTLQPIEFEKVTTKPNSRNTEPIFVDEKCKKSIRPIKLQ